MYRAAIQTASLSLLYLVQTAWVAAQPRPSEPDLASIVSQLTAHKRPASKVELLDSGGVAAPSSCGMQPARLKVSRGSDEASFPVLIEKDGAGKPATFLASLNRMSVDADGAGRAYHPEDPFGERACTLAGGRPEGVCALDNVANAGMRIFHGSTRLRKGAPTSFQDAPDLPTAWSDMWPKINARELRPLSLADVVGPDGPRDYNLIHWPERNLSFAFKTDIVPATRDGYPCRFGADSANSGYFISATTLTRGSRVARDGCRPQRYIDAEMVPFFVFPTERFGNFALGDIVIGYLRVGADVRMAYGIAADTGPVGHLGEGSIAFNKALLGRTPPVLGGRDLNSLDIDLRGSGNSEKAMAVLVFGGSRRLLKGDYSAANIERIGRREFDSWSARRKKMRRMTVCVEEAVGATK